MAKPDWGELQQRFLSEHAATGVSPKDWCEAQGLNYATARRYIKKPTAQTAQKTAQKKLRTAQKEMCAEELVDSKLSPKVKRFIAEYLKDQNATAAAERAGYSDPNYGRQLLTNPNVAQAIAQQQKASIVRTLGSADEVLEQMWRLATFDANQLSQYRRGSCRYCWGFGHQYQWRDAVEYEEKRLEALERKLREPLDVGGYGYDHTSAPNPECPRCNGDGIGQPFFADTRKLAPDAALAYSGVKLGKNGVEITATGSAFAGANIPTTFTPSGQVTLSWSKAAWEIYKKTFTGETVPFSFTLENAEGAYIFEFPEVQISGDWPDAGSTDIVQVQLDITAANTPPTADSPSILSRRVADGGDRRDGR
ncbi:terminase small subunit [Klebsiella grimontii]|uniref:terminase small subunit n=1 Tax=Klebsiella grimontii TaxID=2058152 RepID=UPI001CF6DBA7|nr:terminase small subunit [Klebsiella grimontii]